MSSEQVMPAGGESSETSFALPTSETNAGAAGEGAPASQTVDHILRTRLSEELEAALESADPVAGLDNAVQTVAKELSRHSAPEPALESAAGPNEEKPGAIETLVSVALEMEDDYLRIHTALGSDLILLRLRDALAELGPSRGRQVHRSWWVAEGAVASAARDARRPMLVLRNGQRVPVSKTFRDQVKQAGWLA